MTKENFKELTTEDLTKKKKNLTFLLGLIIGASLVLLFIIFFQSINKGLTPLFIVPFAIIPIMIMCNKQLKSMKKELESRKLD